MKSILIIGAGKFGVHIAKRMYELDCEIMAIDRGEKDINEILPYVTNAQIGDATNEEFIRSLGVENYDVCIVTIGDNFQSSLETTSLLKELGAKFVVSRAANDVQMKFLLRNGADDVVYPEKQTAIRIATKYASDNILDFIQLDGNCSIFEMQIPQEWRGKTLAQLDIRRRYNINVISIRRGSRMIVPSPDTVMDVTDTAFVIGELKEIQKCFRF
ncbi:MAG: TrkA family potassium uptake protein [Clostridia bacterium]|nr:TrkA family potassium uptake protein [Clostridia bacterium]